MTTITELLWSGEARPPRKGVDLAYIFRGTHGPRDADILIVGDCYSEKDRAAGHAFAGSAGTLLKELLAEVNIDIKDCLLTNVVNERPLGGDMRTMLMVSEKDASTIKGLRPTAPLLDGLTRLDALISHVKPRLIIACGVWPLWWLTDSAEVSTKQGYKMPKGIDNYAGSQLWLEHTDARPQGAIPVLPIYHPANILKQHYWRVITRSDLERAAFFRDNSYDPEAWVEQCEPCIMAYPTCEEVCAQLRIWLAEPNLVLSNDIETFAGRIHIMGLGDADITMSIPFFDIRGENLFPCYTKDEFTKIWTLLRELFSSGCRFIGQNYAYDIQYITHYFAVVPFLYFDTMIAQHVLFPALQGFKGLDSLARMWCDHNVYWKDERKAALGEENLIRSCKYNAKDVYKTYQIYHAMTTSCHGLPVMDRIMERMEVSRVTTAMTRRGIAVNDNLRQRQLMEMRKLECDIERWLNAVVPVHIRPIPPRSGTPWYRSPAQTAELFYRKLGLGWIVNPVSGGPATDKEALVRLSNRYPHLAGLFSALIIYRSVGTLASNFLSAELSPDYRTRSSYNLAGPITNRLASSEDAWGRGANLQNIPRDRAPMELTKQDLV